MFSMTVAYAGFVVCVASAAVSAPGMSEGSEADYQR